MLITVLIRQLAIQVEIFVRFIKEKKDVSILILLIYN